MESNFPLVKVKWLDAQTGFSQLMPISEFKKEFKPFYNYSFGYLLEDNKDHIILGFLLMDSEIVDEETGVKHWQLIPKGMVKEITLCAEEGYVDLWELIYVEWDKIRNLNQTGSEQ